VFKRAVELGVTLFNTATFYGPLHVDGFGANLRLLKPCIASVPRSKIQLMVKIGMDTRAPIDKTGQQWIMRGDPQALREDVEFALSELGVEYIDIIVLCRVPHDVPIEISVAAMQQLVAEGKARHIGLSEAGPAILRRAVAVAPVFCIEQEWSLQSRDIEASIVPTCRELGIKIVAYSPLGRGFMTGQLRSRDDPAFGSHDFRLMSPRFSEENLVKNLRAVDAVAAIAARKGCSIGQLSLAFLHAQGEDVIPIPGTTSVQHLEENLAACTISLTLEDLAELDKEFPPTGDAVVGDRYAHTHMLWASADRMNPLPQ
jgi:aryl-alcohol dehydrogenase-like predicted oxidoreductase